MQPPSGGCVLKRCCSSRSTTLFFAATFGWLCVETSTLSSRVETVEAATFGWLCVETLPLHLTLLKRHRQPPSGGCVLKQNKSVRPQVTFIAATFGWLCVETPQLV